MSVSNLILSKVTEELEGWVVYDSYAEKEGAYYEAKVSLVSGPIRIGIYHKGYPIWYEDVMDVPLSRLRELVHNLHIELLFANDSPRSYINDHTEPSDEWFVLVP